MLPPSCMDIQRHGRWPSIRFQDWHCSDIVANLIWTPITIFYRQDGWHLNPYSSGHREWYWDSLSFTSNQVISGNSSASVTSTCKCIPNFQNIMAILLVSTGWLSSWEIQYRPTPAPTSRIGQKYHHHTQQNRFPYHFACSRPTRYLLMSNRKHLRCNYYPLICIQGSQVVGNFLTINMIKQQLDTTTSSFWHSPCLFESYV